MHEFDISEYAYKNGYETGLKDGKEKWIHPSEKMPNEKEQQELLEIAYIDKGMISYTLGFYYNDNWRAMNSNIIYPTVIAWKVFEKLPEDF